MTARREKGAVLVTGLILLVMVMMLGMGAIRTITLQERLAGASVDYNNAFQAAETALRAGETTIAEATASDIERFYKRDSSPAPAANDLAQGFSYWNGITVCDAAVSAPCATTYPLYGAVDDKNPKFIIEVQGPVPGNSRSGSINVADTEERKKFAGGSTLYKITALGRGTQEGAAAPISDVVLQTTYTK
jgi:type IV pilus assembly protein PilX